MGNGRTILLFECQFCKKNEMNFIINNICKREYSVNSKMSNTNSENAEGGVYSQGYLAGPVKKGKGKGK